jgi:hypothetical protein
MTATSAGDSKVLNSDNTSSSVSKNASVIVIGPKNTMSVSVGGVKRPQKALDRLHLKQGLVGSSSSSSSKANSIIFLGECEMPITRERKAEPEANVGVRRANSVNSAHSSGSGRKVASEMERKYFSNVYRR